MVQHRAPILNQHSNNTQEIPLRGTMQRRLRLVIVRIRVQATLQQLARDLRAAVFGRVVELGPAVAAGDVHLNATAKEELGDVGFSQPVEHVVHDCLVVGVAVGDVDSAVDKRAHGAVLLCGCCGPECCLVVVVGIIEQLGDCTYQEPQDISTRIQHRMVKNRDPAVAPLLQVRPMRNRKLQRLQRTRLTNRVQGIVRAHVRTRSNEPAHVSIIPTSRGHEQRRIHRVPILQIRIRAALQEELTHRLCLFLRGTVE